MASHPEVASVLEDAKAGRMEPREAVKKVWELAARNAALQGSLESALFDSFGVVPQSTALAHFPDRTRMLERWGFDEEDLLFTPFEDRPDYKMLHPLLMGMIVEFLQFDGDVPELRTGRLPEGGFPAVPVHTRARDPAVIGALLRTASREVAAELSLAQEQHDAKVRKMVEAIGGTSTAVTGLVRQETERGVGVPGYLPGHRAEMRTVAAPSAVEINAMTFKERQELAHKALTSTQGRRSAVPVIEGLLLEELRAAGHSDVIPGEGASAFAEVEWVLMIDGGRAERNPRFNFIDTAARALAAKVRRALEGRVKSSRMFLQVKPVNEIEDRRVGWCAILSE